MMQHPRNRYFLAAIIVVLALSATSALAGSKIFRVPFF